MAGFATWLARAAFSICLLACWLFAGSALADAAPLQGAWTGVNETISPANGVATQRVAADAAADTMSVTYSCGAGACTASGPQIPLAGGQTLIAPNQAGLPAPFFVISQSDPCASRFGQSARIGVWLTPRAAPVVSECLLPRVMFRNPDGRPRLAHQPLIAPQIKIGRAHV